MALAGTVDAGAVWVEPLAVDADVCAAADPQAADIPSTAAKAAAAERPCQARRRAFRVGK